ncbi:MAG TPA: cysteine desulfurase family protein [Candidatus Saccharimonadales bacterium]|nr:cysteine desulfurase family protein [Candidatus Saccharimonadales bacterium]
MRHVYLDHQSATPVLAEVLDAMKPFFTEAFGNPSSLHQYGLRARDAMADARAQIGRLINAESPEDIIFTSDGTESANLAIKGTAWANRRKGNHIVLSKIEHPSALNSVAFLEKHGFTSTRVEVDAQGRIDPAKVRAAITDKTILIAIHHVNHDIGTVEPIREIAAAAHDAAIPLYVDADASAGWLPIDLRALGADLLSFSPHRFYGPKGVGILYRQRRARLEGILHGGDQEGGRRAGIENVAGIVGAGVAAEIAQREMARRAAHCARLQKRLWDGLRSGVPRIKLNGPEPGPGRSPLNLNISVEGTEGEGQLLLCDTRGIAVASGTGCLSKSLKASHVLEAIGLDSALAGAAVIFSLGKDNSDEDIDYVLETFPKIIAKLRAMSPSWEENQAPR